MILRRSAPGSAQQSELNFLQSSTSSSGRPLRSIRALKGESRASQGRVKGESSQGRVKGESRASQVKGGSRASQGQVKGFPNQQESSISVMYNSPGGTDKTAVASVSAEG